MVAGQIEWYTSAKSFTVKEYRGGTTSVKFMCLEALIEYLKALQVGGDEDAMSEITDPSKWENCDGVGSVGVPDEVPATNPGLGIENPAMYHV